jgi:hypothetical protein
MLSCNISQLRTSAIPCARVQSWFFFKRNLGLLHCLNFSASARRHCLTKYFTMVILMALFDWFSCLVITIHSCVSVNRYATPLNPRIVYLRLLQYKTHHCPFINLSPTARNRGTGACSCVETCLHELTVDVFLLVCADPAQPWRMHNNLSSDGWKIVQIFSIGLPPRQMFWIKRPVR